MLLPPPDVSNRPHSESEEDMTPLELTHLLEVADPEQPPGGHVGGEAVSGLSGEHSQGTSFRAVHPRLLYGGSVPAAATDPEHQAERPG